MTILHLVTPYFANWGIWVVNIVFMEKCISVPHNGKTILAFLLRRRKYFYWGRFWKNVYEYNENPSHHPLPPRWENGCCLRVRYKLTVKVLLKYFLLLRRKAKIVFPLCGTEIHFSIKTILTTQIQQRNIFLSSRGQHTFFFSYNAKSK
jgi:hypothetical protein